MFQSDSIEGRFGWYRQLAGANYLISVKQILEAEKNIRIRSLIKHGGMTFEDVKDAFKSDPKVVLETPSEIEDWLDKFSFNESFYPDEDDSNIIFVLAGYCTRSVMRSLPSKLSCKDCVSLLIKSTDVPEISMEDENELTPEESLAKDTFLKQINRGGLFTPTDLSFIGCIHIHQFYGQLKSEGSVFLSLLNHKNAKELFAKICIEVLEKSVNCDSVTSQTCQKGHSFSFLLGKMSLVMYNLFSKNYVAEENDGIRRSKKRVGCSASSDSKKISKLSSEGK